MLTPKEYTIKQMHNYPTLYYSSNMDEAMLCVFDHTFNVIGNGIDSKTLLEECKNNKPLNKKQTLKYSSEKTLFVGYTKLDEKMTNLLGEKYPDFNSDIKGAFSEEEKNKKKDVVLWEEIKPRTFNYPYPNFKKEYSLVWEENFKELGEEWINAALWFYSSCQEFFNSYKVESYHGAFPTSDSNADLSTIADYERNFKKYSSWEEISKAYELEYKGDTHDFITRRFQKDLVRINSFLDETIKMLNNLKHEINNDFNCK